MKSTKQITTCFSRALKALAVNSTVSQQEQQQLSELTMACGCVCVCVCEYVAIESFFSSSRIVFDWSQCVSRRPETIKQVGLSLPLFGAERSLQRGQNGSADQKEKKKKGYLHRKSWRCRGGTEEIVLFLLVTEEPRKWSWQFGKCISLWMRWMGCCFNGWGLLDWLALYG